MDGWMDGWMDGRMDGWMYGWMDGGMDAGWTVVWMVRWAVGWTLSGCWVDCIKNFGTGWSRKVIGMVTEAGRDGQTKTISFNSFFNYKN